MLTPFVTVTHMQCLQLLNKALFKEAMLASVNYWICYTSALKGMVPNYTIHL